MYSPTFYSSFRGRCHHAGRVHARGKRVITATALVCPTTGRAYLPLKTLVGDKAPKMVIMLAAPLREDAPGSGIYVRLPPVVIKIMGQTRRGGNEMQCTW
jgi:hypothetical protein